MRKLLLAALAIAAVPAVAFAEPQKLTDTQMDEVVAGLLNFGTIQINFNATGQVAAANSGPNVCVVVACVAQGNATAANVNQTSQTNF